MHIPYRCSHVETHLRAFKAGANVPKVQRTDALLDATAARFFVCIIGMASSSAG